MNRRAGVAPTTGVAPFSIERVVLFPITRLIFLSGGLVAGVGVLVFGVLATYSTFTPPPTTVVSVSISDLAPIAMGETTASINVQHDIPVAVQQESSVVALYPNTAAEVLLRLFTALGLPEAGVSRVLVRNIREAVRNGDLADQYITNAIDVLSLVAGKEREKQYYAFHDMRLDRIRTARALRQEEAARLEKQARDAWIRAGIAALGFIQASLLLCLLAIERNSRG